MTIRKEGDQSAGKSEKRFNRRGYGEHGEKNEKRFLAADLREFLKTI